MPVPNTINDLSTTAASNSPGGGENPFPELDDHLRKGYSFMAILRDLVATKLSASSVSAFMQTLFDDNDAAAARNTLGAVGLTGAETIAGVKTFASSPVLPGNAANALEAVPKQQLDASPGRLLAIRVFTVANTGQTYTPTAGTASVIVEAVGGGGGGGASFNTGVSQASAGGGGGGGAYGVGRYVSGFSGALLTIGGGGIGSSANASSAGSGATTSFGGLLSVGGGQGGSSMGASSPTVFAASGVPGSATSGANIKIAAFPQCGSGWVAANGWLSGPGGASPLGAGGTSVGNTSPGVSATVGYGGGGSGGASGASSSGQPGGNGAPGVIIVYEYT